MGFTAMKTLISILDTQMTTPSLFGWFHIFSLILTVLTTVALCKAHRKGDSRQVSRVILWTSLICVALELYKQFNYSFTVSDGSIVFDYQWYAFPWQFCSTPMYVGLLAGLTKKGRVHDACCAYLATFSVFAGVCVMAYPGDVFTDTLGINFQTMICHGSMIVLGVYLLFTGCVKPEHKTILKAIPVFASTVGIAMLLNEIAHQTGLLETETFNMFFISPYCDPSLPVYSLVQAVLPFPVSLIVYIAGFTAAAYLILLLTMGIAKLAARPRRAHAAPAKQPAVALR